MLPTAPLPRALVLVGLTLIAAGFLAPWLSRLPLGRLPGDLLLRRDGFTFAFPVVTCLLLSVVATVILQLLRR